MKVQTDTFTIYEVEELKKEFESTLCDEENIQIDLGNVSKIDMSAIQLLISLKKSCDELGKGLVILNCKNEVVEAFEISGTGYIVGV
ncbi:MAG: STAS domain-containing protein [Campylobacterota bacterium]|nr:STAS domain-containing protein [Campylobacterota bacterium]